MPPEDQNNLFEIRVTETGRNYIFKAARIAGVVVTLAVINSSVAIIMTIRRFIKFYSLTGAYKSSYWDVYYIADILQVLVMALNIFAISNYYLFISNLKKNIVKVDEGKFNLSFRFMFKNILFALAVVVINLLATAVYYFASTLI